MCEKVLFSKNISRKVFERRYLACLGWPGWGGFWCWIWCCPQLLLYGACQAIEADSGAVARLEGHRDWRTLECYEPLRLTAGLAQPGEVGLHVAVCFEGLEGCVEDRGCSWVVRSLDAVVHPLAFASRLHYSGAAQVGEVPGDLRLALLQDLDEVTDTDLAAVHEIQQSEACRVGERGE
jgi:hypothetical protein